MTIKELIFDATSVEASFDGKYMNVKVSTEFINEVLDCIEVEDIIEHHPEPKLLYKKLKQKFSDD